MRVRGFFCGCCLLVVFLIRETIPPFLSNSSIVSLERALCPCRIVAPSTDRSVTLTNTVGVHLDGGGGATHILNQQGNAINSTAAGHVAYVCQN